MHPKYTYPSFSFVLHNWDVPESFRASTRRHPVSVPAPSVHFIRDAPGIEALVVTSIPKSSLPRPELEEFARPATPYLRPVQLVCDDDIPLLELGHGRSLNSDDEEEDDDYCSSESYSDEDCSSDWSADSNETCAARNDVQQHDLTPLAAVGDDGTVAAVGEAGESTTDETIVLCTSSSHIEN